MKKNTIFFDIGNVLVFFSPQEMIKNMAYLYQTTFDQIYDFIQTNQLQEKYELGLISTKQLCQKHNQAFFKKSTLQEFTQALNYSFVENIAIYPLLQELKEHNNHLVILSNTCPAHFDFFQSQFSFLSLFDEKILSFKVSLRKPNPKIFRLALQYANNKAFFIDDIEENVSASNRSGLEAMLYENVDSVRQKLLEKGFFQKTCPS